MHEESKRSSRLRRGLPEDFAGVRRVVSVRGDVRLVLGATSMARWLRVSGLWWEQVVVHEASTLAMRRLPASDFGDGGHDLRWHPEAVAGLVSGDVVRNEPEVWGQRSRPSASSWPWKLPDCMELAA